MLNYQFSRRFSTSAPLWTRAKRKQVAVAFDIDGVILRGDHVFPSAKTGLKLLQKHRIPFIFLTNGGGDTEMRKASSLSRLLDIPVDPAQVVLSHTPMRTLVSEFPELKDSHVLVIGKDTVKEVARNYGFSKPVLPDELIAWNPSIWPFHDKEDIKVRHLPNIEDYSRVNFKAIVVMHDSWDWGRDIQLICDVLRSNNGQVGSLAPLGAVPRQSVPIFFSNPDFQWSTKFPLSRMAQGAFRLSLNLMYRHLTGHNIQITEQFGKPFPRTYDYATNLLQQMLGPNQSFESSSDIFAVGDNVLSDIIGANGHNWSSILVKTGVYKEGDDISKMTLSDDILPMYSRNVNPVPKHICHDIGEAIDLIISKSQS